MIIVAMLLTTWCFALSPGIVAVEPPALRFRVVGAAPQVIPVLLRVSNDAITLIDTPAPWLTASLREDAPGELYLLTLTVPAGGRSCCVSAGQADRAAVHVWTSHSDIPVDIPIRFEAA